MFDNLVTIIVIWVIVSIPTSLFFGQLLYRLSLTWEDEKSINKREKNTVNQDKTESKVK